MKNPIKEQNSEKYEAPASMEFWDDFNNFASDQIKQSPLDESRAYKLRLAYEELISNTEKVVQELWEFCDLTGKYDQDKRKRHFAQTASKHQVTKDIYNTSLDKKEFISYKDTVYKDLNLQREFWLK